MKKYFTLLVSICITSLYAANTDTATPTTVDLKQVSVELLKDHPEHIDTLCKMWHDVLGKKNYPDFDAIKDTYTNDVLKNQLRSDELPLALIALLHGKPIGLCALRPTCIPKVGAVPWSDEHPDKKPWFAIFVAAACQQQGVGKHLLQETMRYAQTKFGFDRAFVVPDDAELEALYIKKGCTKIADTTLRDKPAPVLEIEFNKLLSGLKADGYCSDNVV